MANHQSSNFVWTATEGKKVRLHPFSANLTMTSKITSDTQAKAGSISDTSSASTSHISRSSTPPTEISSALSSPVFAPPADTEESRLRREQSDRASSEIGKRLLKGWAMLGDECPNSRCYGIPLVRPPRVGGGKDPRKVCNVFAALLPAFHCPKECVICGTTYTTEVDSAGRERLAPAHLETTVDEGPNSRDGGKVHTQEEVIHVCYLRDFAMLQSFSFIPRLPKAVHSCKRHPACQMS